MLETSNTTSKRDSYMDLVCGLLIVYMIIYHAYLLCNLSDLLSITLDKIFFFFMPWFYYKSGMFYTKHNTKEIAISGIKKYIYPFVIYTIIGECFLWFFTMYKEENINLFSLLFSSIKCIIVQGSTIGNQPLWFLVSLYITKVIVSFLDNKNVSIVISSFFSCIIAWASSYVGAYINDVFCIPYLIMSTSLGIFYYEMGFLLRDIQYNKVVFMIAIFIYLFVWVQIPSQVDVRLGMLKYGNWFVFVISSLAGIIIINNLSRIRLLQLPFLINVGSNSLTYYCFHWILFNIVISFCSIISGYRLLIVLFLLALIILPLYTYWVFLLKKKYSQYTIYL